MTRSVLALVVTAVTVAIPAAASAQAPTTLSFDQPCYSPGDRMTFSGTGYTPSGAIQLTLDSQSTHRTATFDTQADANGAIGDYVSTLDPDGYLQDDEFSAAMAITAKDPEQHTGSTTVTLSRFGVALSQPNGAAPRAGKRLRIHAAGFTNARGKTLYLHYRRGGRTVKSVKLGTLTGDCGDRTKTLSRGLPRGARRGRYQLVFNTSARNPNTFPRVAQPLTLR